MGTDLGHYSYYCKNCGFTQISDDKEYIKHVRKTHRLHIIDRVKYLFCDLVPTDGKNGLYARQWLAEKIISEKTK